MQNMFTGTSVAVKKDGVYQATSVQVSQVQAMFSMSAVKDVSLMSGIAVNRIADANLSHDQKESLLSLAAYMNENNAEPSLYRDLMALVRLMEINNSAPVEQMTRQDAMDIFKAHQQFVADNDGVILSASIMFSQFESQLLSGNDIKKEDLPDTFDDLFDALTDFANSSLSLGQGQSIYA